MNRRNIVSRASIALLGCGLVVARAERDHAADPGSVRYWVLKKMTVSGREVSLPLRPELSIAFSAPGTVSGFSGINNFSAGYRVKNKTIEWTTGIRSTRKGGSLELSNLETAFMTVIRHCTSIAENDILTLSGSAGTLTFKRRDGAD